MTDKHGFITQAELKRIVHYNPETGIFVTTGGRKGIRDGRVLKCPDTGGYYRAMMLGKRYFLHQLAFLYMDCKIPVMVDHLNRIRTDNRWCNLRPATPEINAKNHNLQKNNTSGFAGVNYDSGRWLARIGTKIYLGSFKTKEEAVCARRQAEKEHGYSPQLP